MSDVDTAFDRLVPSLQFSNEDELFWWTATAPSLAQLLSNSGYSDRDQIAHLQWYHRYIIKALGPRPQAGKTPLFQPCPVSDGSAVEHSVNWREREPVRTVRFTIEAVGYEAGTAKDPFNQEASRKLLQDMHKTDQQLSLRNFDTFANAFFLPPEVAESVISTMPPGTPLSQIWMAFDLVYGKAMAKVYFMPILKWNHTGVPTKELVFETIRKCASSQGHYEGSLQLLDKYLSSFPAERSPVIEMVAIDCIESPEARIKCYLRTGANTLAKAKNQYTLGGRLTGETVDEGLQALQELWPILFRLDSDDFDNTEVFPAGSYCGCAVEMKAGQANPQIKLHMPVRKINGTDAQLCESLAAWFERRGDVNFSAKYKSQLTAAFPDHQIETTSGTHSFISFTYTQKQGVYMTMYYSTRILDVHLKEKSDDIWSGYDNLWIKRGGLEHHRAAEGVVLTAT